MIQHHKTPRRLAASYDPFNDVRKIMLFLLLLLAIS